MPMGMSASAVRGGVGEVARSVQVVLVQVVRVALVVLVLIGLLLLG
jgi:hypothetical protein